MNIFTHTYICRERETERQREWEFLILTLTRALCELLLAGAQIINMSETMTKIPINFES